MFDFEGKNRKGDKTGNKSSDMKSDEIILSIVQINFH